ncbi:hypothetical protein BZA77DRAFT_315790 [Pyronema omphalodes]|nr:hypothetical protein BZA77DRAFT_315790 [Pyronema omphalodes]
MQARFIKEDRRNSPNSNAAKSAHALSETNVEISTPDVIPHIQPSKHDQIEDQPSYSTRLETPKRVQRRTARVMPKPSLSPLAQLLQLCEEIPAPKVVENIQVPAVSRGSEPKPSHGEWMESCHQYISSKKRDYQVSHQTAAEFVGTCASPHVEAQNTPPLVQRQDNPFERNDFPVNNFYTNDGHYLQYEVIDEHEFDYARNNRHVYQHMDVMNNHSHITPSRSLEYHELEYADGDDPEGKLTAPMTDIETHLWDRDDINCNLHTYSHSHSYEKRTRQAERRRDFPEEEFYAPKHADGNGGDTRGFSVPPQERSFAGKDVDPDLKNFWLPRRWT